jgi:hypothetical protein
MTLASVAGGAVAPFIATSLYGLTGTSRLITVYATVMMLVSFISMLVIQEASGES